MHLHEEVEEYSIPYRYAVMLFLPTAGLLVSLVYAANFYVHLDYPLASFFNLVHAVCYVLSLQLFRSGRVKIGRHFLTITFLLHVGEHAMLLFPPDSYCHVYYFVGMPLIYMLFSSRQKVARLVYSIIAVGLMFFVEVDGEMLYFLRSFTPEQISIVRMANIVSSFFVLITTIYLYVHLMERVEEMIRHQAITDPLTEMFNRRHFIHLTRKMLELSQRSWHGICLDVL